MDKVRVAMVLITIAITVGPILGIVLVYRDNLLGLVIPPELNQLISGASPGNSGVTENPSQTNQTAEIEKFLKPFFPNGNIPQSINDIIPEEPEVHYNPTTGIFTASFQVKNPSIADMTIKSINGTVECDEHLFQIGPVSLKEPVTVKAGGTANAVITGQWTIDARIHLDTEHAGEQTTKCSLIGAVISFTAFGMSGTLPVPDTISLGEVPLTGGT